jgi:hypothetical protein
MGGKPKAHKKKRISKHILEGQERRKKEAQDAPIVDGENPMPDTKPINKQNRKRVINPIKDPQEAQNYLSAWKHREASPGVWKFNKNTQTWICRNMYDTEKIPKKSFEILTEYLEDLKGSFRKIVNEDAVRRAMRYKEWEKKASSTGDEQGDVDEKKETSKKTSDDDDAEADDKKFNAMDEKDKRKEYKRSRKIIDVFKKQPQET